MHNLQAISQLLCALTCSGKADSSALTLASALPTAGGLLHIELGLRVQRVVHGRLQVLVSLLFDQLRVLQSVDQLKFLFLHPGHLSFVQCLLRGFALQLLGLLGLDLGLAIEEVLLAFINSVVLLLLDHHLDLLCLVLLLVLLLHPLLASHVLVSLGFHGVLLRFVERHRLVLVHAI